MVEETPKNYIYESTNRTVEAARLSEFNFLDLAVWCGATINFGENTFQIPRTAEFVTDMEDVHVGDWIVRHPDGSFTVSTDEEFQAKYDTTYPIQKEL